MVAVASLWLPLSHEAAAQSWRNAGDLQAARFGHTATLLHDGRVLVAGGNTSTDTVLGSAELVDPTRHTSTATGSLGAARGRHTATRLRNGKVLVVGGVQGRTQDGPYLGTAELYDPGTGTWSATGSLSTSRWSHTATLLDNGRVLVVGGFSDATTALSTVELYDPHTGTWSATGALVTGARALHSATRLSNGEVLVAGGAAFVSTVFTVLGTAERYDSATGVWTATASLGSPHYSHTATFFPGGSVGEVLLAGGFTTNGNYAGAETFDPAGNGGVGTWTSTVPLSRAGHSATLLPDGKVMVIAGTPTTNGANVFDPAGNTGFGSWTAVATLGIARSSHTTTLLPSGQMLVIGGSNATVTPLTSIERYDPPNGIWSGIASMSVDRSDHTATLLPSGKVLVAGGAALGGAIATAELFDPAGNAWHGTWAGTGTMSTARRSHTATLLPSGKVLVAGGVQGTSLLASAELYDPDAGTWSATGSMATARLFHRATLLPDGKVLITGGQGTSGELSSAELYDPITGTWSATGSMSGGRYRHTATLLPDGNVLVVGGLTFNPLAYLATAELYDPAIGTFSSTDALATARADHSATLLPSGRVLVAGGEAVGGALTSSLLYDPEASDGSKWSGVFGLATARSLHTATLLPSGLVLVVGGRDGPTYMSTAELFDPSVGPFGAWIAGGSLTGARSNHTTTVLLDAQRPGKPLEFPRVLVAGGSNIIPLDTAARFDRGLAYDITWRPELSTVPASLALGTPLSVTGTAFQGISEASGGRSSATSYPLVQLYRIDNQQTQFVPVASSSWSDTSFTSLPVTDLLPGPAFVTVFTNGLPSGSRLLHVQADTTTTITSHLPAPSIVGQSVTVAYSVTSASGTPTGTVAVGDGVVSCNATVASGQCDLTFLTPGTKNLSAAYAGDMVFAASQSAIVPHQVVCQPIGVTPASLVQGSSGQAYPTTTFSASGAMGGVVWSLSGALPRGMNFVADTLSGTPTESGSFPITVTATDQNGCPGSVSVTLDVAPIGPTVTITEPAGTSVTSSSALLDLAGMASASPSARSAHATVDAPAASVTSVSWANDRGGSGVATGTTSWTARVPVQPGTNVITVTATDSNGLTASDSVTATVSELVYYLAEGATGPFFDLDLVLANPNGSPAPVTITFLKEDGSTVVQNETLLGTSQRTIRVNDVPGLATAAVSMVVRSDDGLPLAVERTMLWDAPAPAPKEAPALTPGTTYYGGHTAKAVESPRTQWLFAEGSQGFFDTYLLLANANGAAATATVTYLVEGGAPVVQVVPVPATSRLTLFAGAVPGLVGKSFGIVVDATLPIIAERAMYFTTGTFWEGGHESAGVPASSTSWFHAEGATGAFFDTYILVSNPNGLAANLAVTYLLDTGVAIPKGYVVPPNGRITINVEAQDAQLASAAVSTTVTADVPVISERAMYWVGGFSTWYEAHNAFGVTATGTRWALAEGRVGTPLGYETYILLANAGATPADVQITYLRTDGTTVVKTYTVAPTSRFNVYVNADVPELADEGFGARIEATNGVPIAVERALYWNSGGQTWGGGTNATAVLLP